MSRKILIKTFFAAVILLTAFGSGEAQIKTRLSPLGNLLAGIQDRADGLNYISETDADVNVFVVGRNVTVLNTETFRAANHYLPDVLIEGFPKEIVMEKLGENLSNYLEANLSDVKCFKVNSIRRDVYVVGLFQGHIVGVKTFAVET